MTGTEAVHVTRAEAGRRIDVRSPLDGAVIGAVPIYDDAAVGAAVERARVAARAWAALGFGARRRHLLAFRRELARRADEFIALVHAENGKTRADVAQELLLVLEHLSYAANHAQRVLRPRRVGTGMFAQYRARVLYEPYGVVAVLGPWNFPLHTPMGAISSALAAGNAVVFKPSEYTPLSGRLIAQCAATAIPVPNLLELVTGDGQTGAALVRSNVDKIGFTGSGETGRRVLAAAAERLTPVLLELGGKGAAIVASDADLERAAQAVVYGAFVNAGQACIAVERAYVVESAYEPFVARVCEIARSLQVGEGTDAHYGAMTLDSQVARVRAHIEDALHKGARALVGGPPALQGRYVPPTVLVDVTPDMLVMREETFGPVLPIARVASLDEAIRLANDTRFGLGAAIFTRHEGFQLAASLRASMTAVNTIGAYAAVAELPFGGVGASGFGRMHGAEGLREFARSHAIAEELFEVPALGMRFSAPASRLAALRRLIRLLYLGSAFDRFSRVVRSLRAGA